MASIDRPHVAFVAEHWKRPDRAGLTALSPTVFAFWTAHLFWLPPRPFLVATLIVAVALHVGEAAYAYRLAHVADRAGVGRANFWTVLKGTSSPTLKWIVKIAAVLHCDAADLLTKAR
jgi:hypothetical protein